jgi:hypothetical protein
MGSGKGFDGMPFEKSMHGGMNRSAIENPNEYLPLYLFEARLGRFNQSNAAGLLR